ncbi:hypothetical protein HN51_043810, partial [Arachis hypogaea]
NFVADNTADVVSLRTPLYSARPRLFLPRLTVLHRAAPPVLTSLSSTVPQWARPSSCSPPPAAAQLPQHRRAALSSKACSPPQLPDGLLPACHRACDPARHNARPPTWCSFYDQGSWESMEGLFYCSTNLVPLTPIRFLERVASFCRERTSLGETHQKCLKLVLRKILRSILKFFKQKYELHFAIPMAGSIIFTLNSRLDASMVSVPLEYSQAKILFVDYQLLEVAHSALDLLCKRTSSKLPILVLVADSDSDSTIDTSSISYEYEMLLANDEKGFEIVRPKSEMDL